MKGDILKYLLIVLICFLFSFNTIIDSAKVCHRIMAEEGRAVNEWVEYQTGIASWYGGRFNGRKTANGEIYDMYKMTSAHMKLPFGTKVKVTDVSTGNYIIVRINDRGNLPKGRVIDLSKGAMQELAGNKGLIKVKLEILKKNDNE